MTKLVCHSSLTSLPAEPDDRIHVWLYGSSAPFTHVGTVGAQVMDIASRLMLRPSLAVMDLVSVAMAVTAADTFVLRADAPDGWARTFEIELPLADPAPWNGLKSELQTALRFLSSDTWRFEFIGGGAPPPTDAAIRSRQRVINLAEVDCVALFSGGLDSAIGALDALAQGRRPLLVSHASRGDAEKQEVVASLLPARCQRMSVNTYPTWGGADDDSMRTRSFQFIALGALAVEAVAKYRQSASVDLLVCENGLIALNPPLTPRRMGSHSTRTAHPYFLETLQRIMSAVGLPVRLTNPYRHRTKGEMATQYATTANFRSFAAATVSCGKWKRRNQQCGRCVPCLIRRASLHAANVDDDTDYQYPDLQAVMSDEGGRDDLIAVQAALLRGSIGELEVMKSGPLPTDPGERANLVSVAARGMQELKFFLASQGLRV